jgi:hypothetical protein
VILPPGDCDWLMNGIAPAWLRLDVNLSRVLMFRALDVGDVLPLCCTPLTGDSLPLALALPRLSLLRSLRILSSHKLRKAEVHRGHRLTLRPHGIVSLHGVIAPHLSHANNFFVEPPPLWTPSLLVGSAAVVVPAALVTAPTLCLDAWLFGLNASASSDCWRPLALMPQLLLPLLDADTLLNGLEIEAVIIAAPAGPASFLPGLTLEPDAAASLAMSAAAALMTL